MRLLTTLFLFFMALAVEAANPAFTDFNTNQFNVGGNKVGVKNGALLTNLNVSFLLTASNSTLLGTNAVNLLTTTSNVVFRLGPTDTNALEFVYTNGQVAILFDGDNGLGFRRNSGIGTSATSSFNITSSGINFGDSVTMQGQAKFNGTVILPSYSAGTEPANFQGSLIYSPDGGMGGTPALGVNDGAAWHFITLP